MGHRIVPAIVALAGLLACVPGVADAQSPAYGGGVLPYTVVPRGFNPSVGIALQPRGDRVALRFDTTLLCGRRTFEAVGRTLAAFDGSAFSARGASRVRALRLRYAWELSGVLSGQTVTGELRIAGVLRRAGRRIRCTRHPARRFRARVGTPPAGAPAAGAPAAAGYLGMSGLSMSGLPAPVVLRTTRDGRKVAARWNAIARCGRGPRERLVNFTPATRIGAAGGFLRKERFTVRYSDAVVRYRVRFGGRFHADGAAGRLRMRAVVMDRRRRVLTRCDTGIRGWHALAEETAAPPGGSPPSGTDGPSPPPPASQDPPPRVSDGVWSLHMDSEPGDYIGQGQTYDFSSPGDRISAAGAPDHLDYAVNDAGSGSEYAAGFFAPPGQTLQAGVTYTDNADDATSATPSDAGIAMSAESRGCNSGLGSFTVDEIAFAPDRTLQAAVVRWTFRCNRGAPAIRGNWSFHR